MYHIAGYILGWKFSWKAERGSLFSSWVTWYATTISCPDPTWRLGTRLCLTYNQHRTKRWFPEFPQEQDAEYPAKTGNGRGRTFLCFVSQATHPEGAGNYSIVVGTTEEVKWTINTDDMHTLRSALRCSFVPRFSCMAEVLTFLACHFIVVFVDRAILSKIIKKCIRF